MKIKLDTRDIESLVIGLLDDDHGISLENYQKLYALCDLCKLQYITKEIRSQENRFFLPIDTAKKMQQPFFVREEC